MPVKLGLPTARLAAFFNNKESSWSWSLDGTLQGSSMFHSPSLATAQDSAGMGPPPSLPWVPHFTGAKSLAPISSPMFSLSTEKPRI